MLPISSPSLCRSLHHLCLKEGAPAAWARSGHLRHHPRGTPELVRGWPLPSSSWLAGLGPPCPSHLGTFAPARRPALQHLLGRPHRRQLICSLSAPGPPLSLCKLTPCHQYQPLSQTKHPSLPSSASSPDLPTAFSPPGPRLPLWVLFPPRPGPPLQPPLPGAHLPSSPCISLLGETNSGQIQPTTYSEHLRWLEKMGLKHFPGPHQTACCPPLPLPPANNLPPCRGHRSNWKAMARSSLTSPARLPPYSGTGLPAVPGHWLQDTRDPNTLTRGPWQPALRSGLCAHPQDEPTLPAASLLQKSIRVFCLRCASPTPGRFGPRHVTATVTLSG